MKKYLVSLSVVMLLASASFAQSKQDSLKNKSKAPKDTTVKVTVADVKENERRAEIIKVLEEINSFIMGMGELKQKEYETLPTDPKAMMKYFYGWKAQQLNKKP